MLKSKNKILVIGANGQLGTPLTVALRAKYGHDNVIAADINLPADGQNYLPFELLNATDSAKLAFIVERYRITQIYHVAAILSAKGETKPIETWNVNMDGLFNVLDIMRSHHIDKAFFPSSIAVFGSNTPRHKTPQDTIRTPETVFGMSKVAGENWCSFYANRFQTDVRSVRFPGIVSFYDKTGGMITDYASDMINNAVKKGHYDCFLRANARLPMIFIDDAIRAIIELMDAPRSAISIRSSYNINAMSFTPAELATEIKKHLPEFAITYKSEEIKEQLPYHLTPKSDVRQYIADALPESVDDSQARKDWEWTAEYDLSHTVQVMIEQFKRKYNPPKPVFEEEKE